MSDTALFIIGLVVLFIVGVFIIPRFLLKRAMNRVIRAFRENNATDASNAKTPEELGLKPRSFMEGFLRGRDYKPYALEILRRSDIIIMTEDGRLYLSEEKLSSSELSRQQPGLGLSLIHI